MTSVQQPSGEPKDKLTQYREAARQTYVENSLLRGRLQDTEKQNHDLLLQLEAVRVSNENLAAQVQKATQSPSVQSAFLTRRSFLGATFGTAVFLGIGVTLSLQGTVGSGKTEAAFEGGGPFKNLQVVLYRNRGLITGIEIMMPRIGNRVFDGRYTVQATTTPLWGESRSYALENPIDVHPDNALSDVLRLSAGNLLPPDLSSRRVHITLTHLAMNGSEGISHRLEIDAYIFGEIRFQEGEPEKIPADDPRLGGLSAALGGRERNPLDDSLWKNSDRSRRAFLGLV